MKKKKCTALVLLAAMTFSLVACGGQPGSKETESMSESMSAPNSSPQLVNSFTDCSSLEEAEGIVGFDIVVPDEVAGLNAQVFRANEEIKMIEVIYKNAEDAEARIRKAIADGDISGDYNMYNETNTVNIDDCQVSLRGNSGTVYSATWVNGDYSYSISLVNGISADVMTELAAAVE